MRYKKPSIVICIALHSIRLPLYYTIEPRMRAKPAKDAALNMRLPADLLEKAKTHAESKGLSLAALVRMLLIQDIEAKATRQT